MITCTSVTHCEYIQRNVCAHKMSKRFQIDSRSKTLKSMSNTIDNDDYCDYLSNNPNSHHEYMPHQQCHNKYINDL